MQSATEGCALANRSTVMPETATLMEALTDMSGTLATVNSMLVKTESLVIKPVSMEDMPVKAEPRVATTLRMEDIPVTTTLQCRYCHLSCSSEAALDIHYDYEHRDENHLLLHVQRAFSLKESAQRSYI